MIDQMMSSTGTRSIDDSSRLPRVLALKVFDTNLDDCSVAVFSSLKARPRHHLARAWLVVTTAYQVGSSFEPVLGGVSTAINKDRATHDVPTNDHKGAPSQQGAQGFGDESPRPGDGRHPQLLTICPDYRSGRQQSAAQGFPDVPLDFYVNAFSSW